MRRDVIFYRLFQRSPRLLFEFVESPPPQAQNYRFESVEIIELPKTQPLDSAYGADDRPRQSSQTTKPDNQADNQAIEQARRLIARGESAESLLGQRNEC